MNLCNGVVPQSTPLKKLEQQRQSVKCHRRHHNLCNKTSDECGCICHFKIEKIEEEEGEINLQKLYNKSKEKKRLSDIQLLDDYICGCWREFWRPFR